MMFGGGVQIRGGTFTDKASSSEGVATLGTLGGWYSDGVTIYRLVKNADGSALTAFRAVDWSNPADGTVSVTGTTADNGPKRAGFVQSAIAASGFGFIAVSGLTEAIADSSISAGDAININTTAGKVDTGVIGTDDIIGYAVDAASADGDQITVVVHMI